MASQDSPPCRSFAVIIRRPSWWASVRYWWVNQNQTYRAEVRGSFMWSPKRNANGVRNQLYENMREVSPGDVVFSFYDTRIKAIGVVTGGAQTGPKPDFGNAGLNWSKRRLVRPGRLLHPEQPNQAEGSRRHSSSVPTDEVLTTPGERGRPAVRLPRRGAAAARRCPHRPDRTTLLGRILDDRHSSSPS